MASEQFTLLGTAERATAYGARLFAFTEWVLQC